jgi:RHS repeat-associated protein
MRGNLKPSQSRLLGLLLLFLITASGVFAFSSAKSHQGKPAVSVETALKAIDFAAENDISIDSEFSANLRQSINFNRNRYYSPALGRFTSKDPVGLAADVNLYRYANNNPLIYVDPYGNIAGVLTYFTVKEILAGAAIVYINTPKGKEDLRAFVNRLQAGANWSKEKIQDAYHSITCQSLPDSASEQIYLASTNSQQGGSNNTSDSNNSNTPDPNDPLDKIIEKLIKAKKVLARDKDFLKAQFRRLLTRFGPKGTKPNKEQLNSAIRMLLDDAKDRLLKK